jgi:hypothetical protein
MPTSMDIEGKYDVRPGPFEFSQTLYEECAPAFTGSGWALEHFGPERVSWINEYRPVWTKVLAVLLFPLGLALLLITEQRECSVSLVPTQAGTALTVTGKPPAAAGQSIRGVIDRHGGTAVGLHGSA